MKFLAKLILITVILSCTCFAHAEPLGINGILAYGDGQFKNYKYDRSTGEFCPLATLEISIKNTHEYFEMIKFKDNIFVLADNELTKYDTAFKRIKSIKFQYCLTANANENALFVSADQHIYCFDENLNELSKIKYQTHKNAHNIMFDGNIAYLIDNIVWPYYILTVDIEDPRKMRLIDMYKVEMPNAHIFGQCLDKKNGRWLVFVKWNCRGSSGQKTYVFSPENIKTPIFEEIINISRYFSQPETPKYQNLKILSASNAAAPFIIVQKHKGDGKYDISLAKIQAEKDRIIINDCLHIIDSHGGYGDSIKTVYEKDLFIIYKSGGDTIRFIDANKPKILLEAKFHKNKDLHKTIPTVDQLKKLPIEERRKLIKYYDNELGKYEVNFNYIKPY